jgi:hypothetical protein
MQFSVSRLEHRDAGLIPALCTSFLPELARRSDSLAQQNWRSELCVQDLKRLQIFCNVKNWQLAYSLVNIEYSIIIIIINIIIFRSAIFMEE